MAFVKDMNVVREVLKNYINDSSLSYRKLGAMCFCSKNTVKSIIDRASAVGVPFDQLINYNDEKLKSLIYPNSNPYSGVPEPDVEYIIKELKKKHVTMKILFDEYKEKFPNGLGYTQFCERVRKHEKISSICMHFDRKAGEKMEIDWSGDTIKYLENNEIKKAHIFVVTIGLSGYTFMKAFRDTKSYSFNMGVIEALNYFGGVPKIAVPDNDKSAVIKASKYSPIINEEFKKLATYYNFVVSPARVRSPRDKPVVENTVFNAAERQLIGASHNKTFSSFSELEKFVYNQLEKFNEKPFQKKEGTRKSVFEKEDKPVLNPLPKTPYEIIISKKVIVGIDYHVQYNHKYYSVPYTYRGKEVMLNIAGDTLKIFSCDDLIATHLLIKEPLKRYSTLKEHMPEKHKALIERSKDNYLDWAKNVNESVYKFVEKLFSKYKIEEQAYRSLAGLINFCNKDKATFIKAIETAIDLNSYSYYCVKNTFDALILSKNSADTTAWSVNNTNTRGKEYYGGVNNEY